MSAGFVSFPSVVPILAPPQVRLGTGFSKSLDLLAKCRVEVNCSS